MASLIKISLEDNETDNQFDDIDGESTPDDLIQATESLMTSNMIEGTLRSKIGRGENLTDEEIYISTETIGNLFSALTGPAFEGFGFEAYEGKELSQKDKSKIALEAITNQNEEKARTLKAKFENLNNMAAITLKKRSGDMTRLKLDAMTALRRIEYADAGSFETVEITDQRVEKALFRGKNEKPFASYKEVLKNLNKLNDSVQITASAAKYESLNSRGSKYDLQKLALDMESSLITKNENTAVYDLNPGKLTGSELVLTVPAHSENIWLTRSIKANFVVSVKSPPWSFEKKKLDKPVNSLSQSECIDLLKSVVKHIEAKEAQYQYLYKQGILGVMELVKIYFKGDTFAFLAARVAWSLASLAAWFAIINALVFRKRMDFINHEIHSINSHCLTGLIAWAASSCKSK